MKAFVCFAFLAVAAAIPLKDSEQIPEGPISYEMLRNAAAFPMPVWRDLPVNILPEGNVFLAIPIPDAMLRGPINNIPDGIVQIIDNIEALPSDVANEMVSDSEIVPSQVNVVYAAESEVSDDLPAVNEIIPDNDVVADKVKVVYAPEIQMFSDNADVEDVAKEIISDSEIVPSQVNVMYAVEPEVSNDVSEVIAPEVVKFVDGPIDLKNMDVPIDAHDIV